MKIFFFTIESATLYTATIFTHKALIAPFIEPDFECKEHKFVANAIN